MGRPKGQYTMESWMIANGKEGDFFYSEKADRHLTSLATIHKRKITTERLVAVTTGKENPFAKNIVRVTLFGFTPDTKPCESEDPEDMCENCNCWKHTRATCS